MTANRGKYAERKFSECCTKAAKRADFAFYRFPDALAGSLKSAPGDFMTMKAGKLRLVEVKETAYPERLPYQNLDALQASRMAMWEMAGAHECKVLIYHTETKLWRVHDLSVFLERPNTKASWFFKDNPGQVFKKVEEAFEFIHLSAEDLDVYS